MSRSSGPHPMLFPILLAMAHGGEDCKNNLDNLISLMQSARDALKSMQAGINTLQAAMPGSNQSTTPYKKVQQNPLPDAQPIPPENE